jgi:hypothetical protein
MDAPINERLQTQLLDGIQALTSALEEQRLAGTAHAEADAKYRQAQATAYLKIMVAVESIAKKPTEPHIKALVDKECELPMMTCRLAEARRESANSLVKSLQVQISAFQSVLSSYRAEAEAVRYGQVMG